MRKSLALLALSAVLVPGLALAQTGSPATTSRPAAPVTTNSNPTGTGANATTANPGGMGMPRTGGDNQISPSQGGSSGGLAPGRLPQGAPGTSPNLNPPNGSGSNTN